MSTYAASVERLWSSSSARSAARVSTPHVKEVRSAALTRYLPEGLPACMQDLRADAHRVRVERTTMCVHSLSFSLSNSYWSQLRFSCLSMQPNIYDSMRLSVFVVTPPVARELFLLIFIASSSSFSFSLSIESILQFRSIVIMPR